MRVVGLDLSLTESGIACGRGVGTHELQGPHTSVVTPGKLRGAERLAKIRDQVTLHVFGRCGPFERADVAVIEAYGYLKGNAMAIPEVHGTVKVAIFDERIPIAVVPPSVLKKWATGSGNAKKAEMIAAAIRRFGFEGSNENEADAWLLMRMGEQAYSTFGLIDPPKYQTEMLERVEWPEVASVISA